jgi:hypothetical protein
MKRASEVIREILSNVGLGVPRNEPDMGDTDDLTPVIEAIERQQREVEARVHVLRLRRSVATGLLPRDEES